MRYTTDRTARILKWTITFLIIGILALSLSCVGASGDDYNDMPLYPMAVRGTVYNVDGSALYNAPVTITSIDVNGTILRTMNTTTDSVGYYSVTFGSGEWQTGGTLNVLVVWGGIVDLETRTLGSDPVVLVDIYLFQQIPEFGLGAVVFTIAVVALVVIITRWLLIEERRK